MIIDDNNQKLKKGTWRGIELLYCIKHAWTFMEVFRIIQYEGWVNRVVRSAKETCPDSARLVEDG